MSKMRESCIIIALRLDLTLSSELLFQIESFKCLVLLAFGKVVSQVTLLVRTVLRVSDAELEQDDGRHDREENPARGDEDCEELALDGQHSLLIPNQVVLHHVQSIAGAYFAWVPESDQSYSDSEGQVDDEDDALHGVEAGLTPGGNAAGGYRPNGCENIYYDSCDKNGEELLTDINDIVHVRVGRHFNRVVHTRLGEALHLIWKVVQPAFVTDGEVEEVTRERDADEELSRGPPKVHSLSPSSLHFFSFALSKSDSESIKV